MQSVRLWILVFGRFSMESVHIELADGTSKVLIPKAGVSVKAAAAIDAARHGLP